MRKYILFAAYLPALVFQASILPLLKFWGGELNLILLLTVLVGLIDGPFTGAVAGLWGGLLLDLFQGRFLGMNALAGMIVGGLVGITGSRMYRDHFLVLSLSAAGATILNGLLIWFCLHFLGVTVDPLGLLRITLPEAILAAVAILPLAGWWWHRLQVEERESMGKF